MSLGSTLVLLEGEFDSHFPSEILLANGYQESPVQALKIGDWLLGYNTTSGTTIPVQITTITSAVVSSLVFINTESAVCK